MINVMHLIDGLAIGGAERVLVDLVNNINKEVVHPLVCITRRDLTFSKEIDQDIPVYCLHRVKTFDLKAFQQFKQIVKAENIQIIHAHGYSSFKFAFIAKLFLFLHLKIVLHAHSSEPPGFLTCFIGRVGIDNFFGVSNETVHWAKVRFKLPDRKIHLLENGIDSGPYLSATPMDVRNFFIEDPAKIGIMVANVRPVKDILTLIDAVAKCQYRSNIGILIAGSIQDKEYFDLCLKRIHQLSLDKTIIFLGLRTDIPNLLASVDFGVLTSERETGPIALLEYMAAGLPFVVTNVGQVAYEVSANGISACVQTKDPLAFAKALDELLMEDENRLLKRIEDASHLLINKFDISQKSSELLHHYESMIR